MRDVLALRYIEAVTALVSPVVEREKRRERGTMLGVDVCEFGGQVLELLWLTMCYRGLMAEKEEKSIAEEGEEDAVLNYTPPALKSLQEITQLDKEDESLNKYKQTLLGAVAIVGDPTLPNVQVTRLTLLCDQAQQPISMELTGDLETQKKQCFTLKEGVEYRVKIHFKVNRDIVAGLKYVYVTYRKGVRVNRSVFMVGSYPPHAEEHEFISPVEEAPKGMLVRGSYHIRSHFTDDDKTDHLSWEWTLSIKKDWSG